MDPKALERNRAELEAKFGQSLPSLVAYARLLQKCGVRHARIFRDAV